VPVRWNYVRWLQDLLATTHPSHTEVFNPTRPATGLDIGIGASCIYSLLACASALGWRMYGSDIDTHSLDHAQRNVDANNLSSRIKLRLSSPEDPLIPLNRLGVSHLDFVMCNPPFYSSPEDMARAYGIKEMPPSAVCTGSTNEMICEGGDVGFVSRILEESLVLRERVQWYSSMLGRLASLQQLMVKLREHGVTNFAVTNLKAGHKTRRWAVAWSFSDLRPANAVARHGELVQAVLPTATEWTVAVGEASIEELDEKVNSILTDLDLKWHWRADLHTGVAFARENVWSRSARRKRKFQQQQKENARIEQPPPSKNLKKQIRSDGAANDDGEDDDDDDESNESDSSSSSSSSSEPIALAVKIICSEGQVNIRWLRGTDFTLWESFCGMLKRSLGARESGGGKGNKMEE
jgi:23S rRNA (adenine1618-N6)-methyltransferase